MWGHTEGGELRGGNGRGEKEESVEVVGGGRRQHPMRAGCIYTCPLPLLVFTYTRGHVDTGSK